MATTFAHSDFSYDINYDLSDRLNFASYWDAPTANGVNSDSLTSVAEVTDINVSATETYNPTPGVNAEADPEWLRIEGTLGADIFIFVPGYALTVLSGNGNSVFGTEALDVLDLSGISSSTVSFNYADTQGGGVVYDPGDGLRVFDAITLSDGSQKIGLGYHYIFPESLHHFQ